MKGKRRSFLGRLLRTRLRRQQYFRAVWESFTEQCADGDMAARFGRPDIYVVDLERMKE